MAEILDRCLFIVGRQRTGTTVLRQALASHPQVADLGEVMHAGHARGFYSSLVTRLSENAASGLHEHWFDILRATIGRLAPPQDEKILLIDIKYNVALAFGSKFVGPEMVNMFAAGLRERGGSVLHLVRRNKLALLTSLELARKTGQWRMNPADARRIERIDLDPRTLCARIAGEEAMDAYFTTQLARIGTTVTAIYEDLFLPDGRFAQDCFDRVAKAFAIEPSFNFRPRLAKQGLPLSQTIANFDAVAAQIENLIATGALAPNYRKYLSA